MRIVITLLGVVLLVAVLGGGAGLGLFWHFGKGLPDYRQLADYEPPVMTRVLAADGRLLAEYAVEKRVFVPIEAMPKRVVNAVLSAEDKSFYQHPGVDPFSILRAVVTNLRNLGSDRRPVGASTITQQVAKNFLLTNEVSLDRKIKEAILALRIESVLSKDRILELYLNEIYLGFGSYGVAAAALNYFNKSLGELSVAEAAFLAGLPKAPNNYHPLRYPDAARDRRDWVIHRMRENGVVTAEEADRALATPLSLRRRAEAANARADFFTEEVRRELAGRYGENQLYRGGLSVRTTLDPFLQEIADRILRRGLETYDRRHGWRGPLARIEAGPGWEIRLADVEVPPGLGDWLVSVVLDSDGTSARVGLADGTVGTIPLAELKWAREWRKWQRIGRSVRQASDVLVAGDVVAVAPVSENAKGEAYPAGTLALRQVPDVDGALVALDPHTGRVLAMSGGYDFARSQFNRATQALRQPGSAFKPFVYLAALGAGFTPATLILDAPFVIDQGPGLPKWRPANYTKKFYGPSTMRLGIEKSRNLMTVRLAQTVGMDKVAEYAERFRVVDRLPDQLSMALGAGETTLLRLTTGYAMIVNGGKRIVPSLIDRIQDRNGRTVFRHDGRECPGCRDIFWTSQPVPKIPDTRDQVSDPASAYQMVSMLQGVVERGTGVRIRAIGKPLAGKTGTTNKSNDAWFVGFSPDLAVGVFVGFDEPRSLGPREQGASVAVPIWRDFMAEALKDEPAIPFRIPRGIRLVRVDARTGRPAPPRDKGIIFEAFKPGDEPLTGGPILEGMSDAATAGTGTGGLY